MTTWGDQTCQMFGAKAVGFETGFSRESGILCMCECVRASVRTYTHTYARNYHYENNSNLITIQTPARATRNMFSGLSLS